MFFPEKNHNLQEIEQQLLANYNRYYRLAYSYVHNEADAYDIVQTGACKAIANSKSLKKKEFASTWIYRIMLNEIFRLIRQDVCVPLDEIEVEAGKKDQYEEVDLKQALHKMDPEDKAVIELKYFEEMTFEEIAAILGENVNTVKSRLYRGLKKLKIQLSDT